MFKHDLLNKSDKAITCSAYKGTEQSDMAVWTSDFSLSLFGKWAVLILGLFHIFSKKKQEEKRMIIFTDSCEKKCGSGKYDKDSSVKQSHLSHW